MIILDLDNCISDDGWRIPRIRWDDPNPSRRYDEYHSLCGFDQTGNQDIYERTVHGIIILTARPNSVYWITVEWLRRAGIVAEQILMREENQHGPSVELKRDQLLSLPKFGIPLSDIWMAYDDRPDVVEMYKDHGISAEVRAIHSKDACMDPASV